MLIHTREMKNRDFGIDVSVHDAYLCCTRRNDGRFLASLASSLRSLRPQFYGVKQRFL